MGIYTNFSNSYYTSHYTEVEPFVGESFNYHELGIIAASEIAANHNAFMKSIALSELAAYEQTGSTDVFYEAVNISGIFEKIKMFFKKVIEKIHKIFHTFIAKMSSWFSGNASFAKNYEKEVIKGWANIKNDWEFKGYQFTHINKTVTEANTAKVTLTGYGTDIAKYIEDGDIEKFISDHVKKDDGTETLDTDDKVNDWNKNHPTNKKKLNDTVPKTKAYEGSNSGDISDNDIKKIREDLPDIKDGMRKAIVDYIDKKGDIPNEVNVDNKNGYDQSEFTEELFKVFRNGQDSKEDFTKDKIVEGYGGSVSAMMTYVKDFDKIKSRTESAEKKLVKGIDDLIKKIDKAQNDKIKDSKVNSGNTAKNELLIQFSSLFQSIYSSYSECVTQAFSAMLTAQKDACTQAKEIAVKVIGQSKKMTEESYDYSRNNSSYDGGYDFISSVKLV